MNRTGLYIALGLALFFGLLFGIYPELDLKVAAFFYDATTKTFPLKASMYAAIARDGAMWIAWAFVIPALGPHDGVLAGNDISLGHRVVEYCFQIALGPSASRRGDAIQRRT